MNHLSANLWETVQSLEGKVPFSREAVESLLGSLAAVEQAANPPFSFYRAGPLELVDKTLIEEVDLRVGNGENAGKSLLGLSISGASPTREDVRARFPDLQVTQMPRGHSLEEKMYFTSIRSWGELSFGFKEGAPDALASIVFEPKPRTGP